MNRLFLGYDPAEDLVCRVAHATAEAVSRDPLEVRHLSLGTLQRKGLYTRPTEVRSPGYWDPISEAPMSTGHAIARFLVPALCGFEGWALFTDGDVLFRRDLGALFAQADPRMAVQVVKHEYHPQETTKMLGQPQTAYARKNWSSVMLFNCGHPANRRLSTDLVNSRPGRDLHQFCWLDYRLIGALDPAWNYLVGVTDPARVPDPAIVHFTLGTPDMPGYEHGEFADEWRAAAARLAR